MTVTDDTRGTVLLAQIIGVEKSAKQGANRQLGGIQKALRGGADAMNGMTRTYRPLDPDDPTAERFPDEFKRVQVTVDLLLDDVRNVMTDLMDIVYTRESGNAEAKADVTVGDVVVARDVPVTYLLFLDKQLDDLLDILRSVPVHDMAEEWSEDASSGLWRTPPRQTAKTKKVPVAFVKAPATDKHAAQVETHFTDVVTGYWDKVQFTGAWPVARVRQAIDRVTALKRAVKAAREEANAQRVPQRKIGQTILDYVFAP